MNPARRTAYRRGMALLTAILAFLATACGSANPLGGGAVSGDLKSIKVGSADFPESQLLAKIYAMALTAKGFKVDTKMNIGSREVYMPALLDGGIIV